MLTRINFLARHRAILIETTAEILRKQNVMLTISDIEQVRTGGSSAAIVASAANVAGAYCDSAEASRERGIAEEILAKWLNEAAQEVREALARQLRCCPFLPRNLALEMAADVETVAVPMLLDSPVFTEDDLNKIARNTQTAKQIAVAGRREVPRAVAAALIETRKEDVVATLARNEGANLSEALLHRIVDSFEDSASVHEALVSNASLPVAIGERLLTMVAAHLRHHLVIRFDLPQTLASELTDISQEAAMSAAVPEQDDFAFAQILVAYLYGEKRLTQTFLLRALCDRRFAVFEVGLARLAGLPFEDVDTALRAGDPLARSNLFLRAGISRLLVRAFDAAVSGFFNGALPPEVEESSDSQIRWVINKMVQQYEDIDPSELEAVMTRLYRKLQQSGENAPAPDDAHRMI